jgi:cholesterol oxidase
MAVTAPDDRNDFASSVAITSSIYPDPDTHVEVVTYGEGGGAISLLYTLMTGDGTRLTRPLLWLGQAIRHPLKLLRTFWPFRWSRRTVILLIMQSLDNAIRLVPKRRLLGRGVRLQTEQDPERPNPTYIPVAEQVTTWFADQVGGFAQGGITESLFNIPTTAHILGGAVIGSDPDSGVIDPDHRVFGYQNLLVCDGAAIPANPGVNPSLTITAMAERAMAQVPPKALDAGLAELPQAARAAA